MKKVFKIFAFLLWTIMLCFPVHVSAVIAYPYPVEVKQPNGETITIQAHGDEFFHYVTTTDGYVIALDSEGYFTFAEINSEGNIQPGKVRVSANMLKSGNNSFLRADSPEFIQTIKQPVLSRRSGALKNVAALRSSSASRMRSAKNIAAGDTPALVILAEFTDQKFSNSYISGSNQAFTNMLNTSGYQPSGATGFTGSVRDYFISSSDGAYSPAFKVYGPVQLPNNMAFYGANDADGNDKNPGQMIIDAVTAAQKYFNLNLADFPCADDGSLDNVCVIYAGYNEAENTNKTDLIWPHQWYLSENFSVAQRTVGGVVLNSYMCTSELRGQSPKGTMAGIGTFCHEYGHTLGQPDLYDANGSTDGWVITEPGSWCIMSAGNYNNNGNTPPTYGAIERWWLGWIDLWYLTEENTTIPPITSSNYKKTYAIDTPTDGEFFTLEVRKKEGWDSALPGEGMLVYHIDMSDYNVQTEYGNVTMAQLWGGGMPNIAAIRPGMQLMTANGEKMTLSGSSYIYKNYGGHPFPGTEGHTSISDNTTPGFLSWNGQKSGVSISNIVRNADGSVLFSYSKSGNDMKENNINSPVAFSNDNIIYFKNISGNTQVCVYDVKGVLYSSKSISGPDNLKITVPGIYIVKLQTNNEVFTYKIIIK